MDSVNWDARYSNSWRFDGTPQKHAIAATHNRCCWCLNSLTSDNRQVHHAMYSFFMGKVKDFERHAIGVAVFPVCTVPCHQELHKKANWNYTQYGDDPVFGAGNTPAIVSQLRRNFKKLQRK